MLTYDPELLERAVIERRSRGGENYLDPDKLSWENLNWQMQCRIYEHIMDYAFDHNKVPNGFR